MGDAKLEETQSPATVRGGGRHAEPAGSPDDSTPVVAGRAFDPPRERFIERSELGRGGMGRVADAYDRSLDRAVAIKTIHTSSAFDLVRFEREAKITARLEHPGIVPLYDAGRDEQGHPYYVMRKVDGQPLDKVVDQLDLEARLALVPNLLAACDAVAFAHARGVIHRDLKPTNILVGAFGETLVIDWGLARAVESQASDGPGVPTSSEQNLTRVGTVAGTPGFMSPEQARGEAVDARADVYALGATLFFVLAGALPFSTSSATEMVELAGANRQAEWTRIPSATPADLVAIVRKAMAPDDDDRYADASAMASDLRRFVTGKLVGAHRYGFGEHVRRFIQRNRAAVAVAALAILVITIGGVLSVRRVLSERDEARQARVLSEQAARDAILRNDEYVIQHAIDLLDTDPLQTIAVLRHVRPESLQWRAAAVAAEAARTRGLPFGFSFPTGIRHFSFSPSGRWLLVRDIEDLVWLIELRTRERRALGTVTSDWLDWLDSERWLAGMTPTGIELVDITTGVRRTIPAPALDTIVHGRDGSAYALTAARTLHRFDASSTELGAVVDEVDAVEAVIGQGLAVVRARRVHLLRAGTWHELPGEYVASAGTGLTAAGDAVLARVDGKTCLWHLAVEPRLSECVSGGQNAVGGAPGDGILMLQGGALWSYRKGVLAPMRSGAIRLARQVNHSFVVLLDDGSIWVRERGRWLDLGRRGNAHQVANVSDGGEWLASAGPTGDVLVYHLESLRPRSYAASGSTHLGALTNTEIWVTEPDQGLIRIDRATGARALVMPGMMINLVLSSSRRWGTVVDMPGNVTLIDTVSERAIEVARGHTALPGLDPPYAVDEDGELYRYGYGAPERVANLGGDFRYVHANGDLAAVAVSNRRLCRLQLSSGHAACIGLPELADHATAESTGSVWAATSSAVYRWDGFTLLRFPTRQPTRSLRQTENFIVAVGATSVTSIERTTFALRELPAPSLGYTIPISGDQILVTLQRSTLGVFDVASGRSVVTNPNVSVSHFLYATDAEYAVMRDGERDRTIDVYSGRVPVEPAELRRWLHDVTNMRDVPGSEVVSWP